MDSSYIEDARIESLMGTSTQLFSMLGIVNGGGCEIRLANPFYSIGLLVRDVRF